MSPRRQPRSAMRNTPHGKSSRSPAGPFAETASPRQAQKTISGPRRLAPSPMLIQNAAAAATVKKVISMSARISRACQ
jgi:hypothetical protein